MTINTDALRAVMRHWPAGVTVVSAQPLDSEKPIGMTASSFLSVSLEPPLIAVSLHKETETAMAAIETRAFAVSILSDEQSHLSSRFAGFDPDYPEVKDRFNGLDRHTSQTGAPILSNALAWLDCSVWQVYDGSTHHLIVGEVVAISEMPENPPDALVYYNRGYYKMVSVDG